MANWSNLIASIKGSIYENDNQLITGSVMQEALVGMINNLGADRVFAGVATPSTSPGSPDGNVFYLASQAGTYSNFGGFVAEGDTLYIITNDSSNNWTATDVFSLMCLQELGDSTLYPVSQKGVTDAINNLDTEMTEAIEELLEKIEVIAAGVNVTLSVSPTVIYMNEATVVTFIVSVSGNATPSSIELREESTTGTPIGSNTGSSNLTVSKTYTRSSQSLAVYAIATVQGMTFTASGTVRARDAVYYGFGTSAEYVIANGTKASARTSAAGYTYAATNNVGDGAQFYLCVPNYMALDLVGATYTMGGAPYVMNLTTVTVGSITYFVACSGAVYDSGATVNVTVTSL